MEKFELNLTFKGERDYLHGTDIYSGVMTHLGTYCQVTGAELTFHSVARNSLEGRLFTEYSVRDTNLVALIRVKTSDRGNFAIGLHQTGGVPTGRVEYNEGLIIDAARYDLENKTVTLSGSYPFNTLEKVVALNKGLLSKIFQDKGKWYFVKLLVTTEINRLNPNSIRIRLSKSIGSKITKSTIELDGKEYGYISFSKVAN